ncbi:hypothetical protein [Microbacterium sp. 179-I 3D4 NHS]|uniref:hypothetical protein n=1 Tax=Microbacterium sp. 179-I 3D4 NHS TaxID=3142381 RepID=UPI0039A04BC5
MTTAGIASDLAEVMVPIGWAGAIVAILCAIVAGVAIVRGAGGLSGGAVGVWIPFALLSLTASFANEWMPLLAAAGALGAMLVFGGLMRAVLALRGRRSARVPTAPTATAPVTASVTVRPAAPSVATGTIAVVS